MGMVKDQLFNAVFYAMNQTQVVAVAVVIADFGVVLALIWAVAHMQVVLSNSYARLTAP